MEYAYITDNNLENKQMYTYSQYGGDAFLDAYVDSRMAAIDGIKRDDTEHITYYELKYIYTLLLDNSTKSNEIKTVLDGYVKSFEVRKRLYLSYDAMWKPTSEDYQDYNLYIIFSRILEKVYEMSNNLKYLSCLMKLNDTLVSLIPVMPYSCILELKSILQKEIDIYRECARSAGV